MKTQLLRLTSIVIAISLLNAACTQQMKPPTRQMITLESISSPTYSAPKITSTAPTTAIHYTATSTSTESTPEKVYLSDIDPIFVSAQVFGRGRFPENSGTMGTFDLAGRLSENDITGMVIQTWNRAFFYGLFTPAPAHVVYLLNGLYSTFDTLISLQSKWTCGDGVMFQVELDDRIIYESKIILPTTEPQTVHLKVVGGKLLALHTLPISGGDCDAAIWGDPYLTTADEATIASLANITPTPNPNLPCNDPNSEKGYLFLNCADIRRIRQYINEGTTEVFAAWYAVKEYVENYRINFPTTYDPEKVSPTLTRGGGNYVMRDMGIIYLITGNQEISVDIIRLLDLVKSNTPSNTLMSGMGKGAVVVQSIIFAYLTVRDSGLLSEDQIQAYDQFFIHQAQLYEATANSLGNLTPLDSEVGRNIIIGANVSAATIALVYSDNSSMQKLYGRVRQWIDWQIGHWWEEDGGWGENTDTYGYRVMEELMLFSEALLKTTGENIFEQDFNGRNINSICSYFLKTMTPIGDVLGMNDDALSVADAGIFLLCGERTQEPRLIFAYTFTPRHPGTPFHTVAWAGISGLKASKPEYLSLEMPSTGVNILRSGWTDLDGYFALQYTQSRVHMEASTGAAYLYDRGPWIVANGYYPVGSQSPNYPTDQHSTLALDHRNQEMPLGRSTAFGDLGEAAITAISDLSYRVLDHSRTALWIKPWHEWIVIDDAAALDTYEHNLQLRWYIKSEIVQSNENEWAFNRNWLNWNEDVLHITLLPGMDASYKPIERTYPWDEGGNAKGVEMDVNYPYKPVRLISVLSNVASGEQAPITSRLDEEKGTQITSEMGNATWEWMLPEIKKQHGEVAGYVFDGKAACASYNNEMLIGYCLMNGQSLASEDKTWIMADESIYAEADFENGSFYVNAEVNTSVSFYWDSTVITITENGSEIPFQTNLDLITILVPAGNHILTIQ